ARLGVLDGVLEQGVEGDPELFRISAKLSVRKASEHPVARRDLGPAQEDILQEAIELDLVEIEEVRLVRSCQKQQSLEDPLHAAELVQRDVDLRRAPAVRASEDLEMSARDRHGRSQLVRGVVEELLLPLERRLEVLGVLLGNPEQVRERKREPGKLDCPTPQ